MFSKLLQCLNRSMPQSSPVALEKQLATHRICFVLPNEKWELVIEFEDGHRLFKASIAREEFDWQELAYPHKLKNLTYTEQQVEWPGGRVLGADYLYEKSVPLPPESLQFETLRLGYQNQAPTDKHPSHHVYGVYLYPFHEKPFAIGESIGGGHAEMGYSVNYTLAELLALQDWKKHFELSGGAWAVPLVSNANEPKVLLKLLVEMVCQREGGTQ
jgi:hypothetical protein